MPEQETEPLVLADGEVEFFDQAYRMADKSGKAPLLRYAKAVQGGLESSTVAGYAAMYDLLKSCLHPDEWDRWNQAADDNAADDEDLWAFITRVWEAQAARPTVRSSVSSGGPSSTEPNSTTTPAARVIARLDGRPDLQLAVMRAQEEMAATA